MTLTYHTLTDTQSLYTHSLVTRMSSISPSLCHILTILLHTPSLTPLLSSSTHHTLTILLHTPSLTPLLSSTHHTLTILPHPLPLITSSLTQSHVYTLTVLPHLPSLAKPSSSSPPTLPHSSHLIHNYHRVLFFCNYGWEGLIIVVENYFIFYVFSHLGQKIQTFVQILCCVYIYRSKGTEKEKTLIKNK